MASEADQAWNQMLGKPAGNGSPAPSSREGSAAAPREQPSGSAPPTAGGSAPPTSAPASSPLTSAARWGAVAVLGLIAVTAVVWVILSNRTRPIITQAPPSGPPSSIPSASAGGPAPAASPGSQLNLNTATAAQLEQLPGIGPALAARIIADRDTHGRYTSIDQLDRVSGIGAKTIEKLRPYLTVK